MLPLFRWDKSYQSELSLISTECITQDGYAEDNIQFQKPKQSVLLTEHCGDLEVSSLKLEKARTKCAYYINL